MEVKDFPNYLIFRNGAVLSKKTKIFLKSHNDGNGYYKINLCNLGKKKTFLVHRLVALYYIPNPHNYPEVDHINRNKTDNTLSNLRWVTRVENSQNQGIYKSNTSGIKNVYIIKSSNSWRFSKVINNKEITFTNKNKQLVLWVKFTYLLMRSKMS